MFENMDDRGNGIYMEYKDPNQTYLTSVKLARYIRKLSNKCSLNIRRIFSVNIR